MRLFLVTVVAAALLAGCNRQQASQETPVEEVEQTAGLEEIESETTEDTAPATTPQSPQQEWANASDEEKVAIKERNRTQGPPKQSITGPPEYEVAEISPGTAATDLSQGEADVYITGSGGRSYGQMVNGPALQEIADEIREDNPEYEVLVASFYSGREKSQDRLMGVRYSFESDEAVCGFFADFQDAMTKINPNAADSPAFDADECFADPEGYLSRLQTEQVAEEFEQAWRQSGTNEAGQDVSKIPEMTPEERKAEANCLKDYYDSLPREQRGPESQRLVREANEQGVTPGEVVGC